MRQVPWCGGFVVAMSVFLVSCGGGDILQSVPTAVVGCEAATAALLEEGERMLPGRDCLACHRSGGIAGEERLGAAGTVYAKPGISAGCNSNGAAGVTVEILDGTNSTVLATTTTNEVGNFDFRQIAGASAIRARLRKGTLERTMVTPVPVTSGCASCHNPSGAAGDRLYLQ